MSSVRRKGVDSGGVIRFVDDSRVACPLTGCSSAVKPTSLQQHLKNVHHTSVVPPPIAKEITEITRDGRLQLKERMACLRRLMIREAPGVKDGCFCPATCESTEVLTLKTVPEHVLNCGGDVTDDMRADARKAIELDNSPRESSKTAGGSWVSNEAEAEQELATLAGGPFENAVLLPMGRIACPFNECEKVVMRKGLYAHCVRAHPLDSGMEEQLKAFRNVACRYHMRRRNAGVASY